MSGFSRNMVRQGGQVREQRARPPYLTADTAATLTAAVLASGRIVGVPTAARNYTLDTAANLLASSSFADMDIGDSFEFVISANGAFALTVVVAAGITNAGGAANLVVAASSARTFLLTKTSATAMTILGL